ncbi:MAG: cell wall-binding repeat-containing protein, partial [Microcella sp.]|nr:cell wall-binding repeat-containing protein [Microcella sp.]
MVIDRISGPDRYSTAVAVSQQAFANSAPIVFLASGADYPDALSAAPMASLAGGPLLLTAPTGLPPVVATELQRLNPARVIIVGAEVAVSARVAQQVVDLGFAPERVAGRDRYATARALVRAFIDESATAYVATGRNFPDALAAAAAAGSIGAPVLLVNGTAASLDADSLALLDELGVNNVLVAGGPNVVSEGIEARLKAAVTSVERLSGRDRYLTATAINQHAFAAADRAFVATGVGFADALAGAVYAATEQAPLYSSPVACLPREALADITERLQVSRLTLLGGPPALGPRVAAGEPCTTEDDDRATSVAQLTAALQSRLRSLPGTYSVSVRQLGGLETSVSIRGSVMQEPVSVIKVFVAYAVLDRIDRGLLSFTTPTRSQVSVRDCLRVMIHASDNYCHWDLVALVGAQNLNNQFWAEGYRGTVYQGHSGGGTYHSAKRSTTDDLALLLSRLHRGELLSPANTNHFITLLETQLWRSKLPSGVSTGVPVGNKTGSAWNANGWYHSDVGIISAPGGTYVVAVLGSSGATAAGVRALGRTAYEHF